MKLQDLLNQLKIPYLESGHHHCRAGWIQLRDCPFCGGSNYHLGWNKEHRNFSCWRCGGHSLASVAWRLRFPREATEELLRYLIPPGKKKHERARVSLKEPSSRADLLPAHKEYLRSRGYDPAEIVRLWHVEGLGVAHRLSWRLYIPIYQDDIRVSWTTRSIGTRATQRYISASSDEEVVNIKEVVYGYDYCEHSIVVCEGPLDAWAVGPGATATFGTVVTPAQIAKIAEIPYRIICFDSDRTAQKKALELAGYLSCLPGVTQNVMLDAKDPGEASKKEIRQLRKFARL